MMFLFDNFSTHFDGIFARNWELRTFKLAPESNKNSVGIWWHFALIIVCHLPILRQCLHFSASTDTVSLTLVSIISTSLSTHSFMHSWYCNTLHFNVWSFDLLCLRLPRWLQALSEFCGLVSLKDAVSWLLTLLTHHGPEPHICVAIFSAYFPSAPDMGRWFQCSFPQCPIHGAWQTARSSRVPQIIVARPHLLSHQRPIYVARHGPLSLHVSCGKY